MGLIRGALLTLVAILLFLSLFAMNTFLTMSMSLSHDNVQSEMTIILDEIIRNQTAKNIDLDLGEMQVFCQDNEEIVKKYDENVFTFPCDVVNEGSEALIVYAVSDLVEQNYYKEYDCEFWDCSYTPPYHLISLKAKQYWKGWFYWSLLACVALAVLGFVFIENKNNLPFLFGGLMIISALPFVRIAWLLSLLGYWSFLQYFTLFFSKAYNVFLIMFVTGVLLIGIGVVLKFLGIGKFIGRLFGGGSKSGKIGELEKKKLKQEIKQEIKQEKEDKREKKEEEKKAK